MKFSVHQNSQVGSRTQNEDRIAYAYTRQTCLFMLADGMGGHPEGATAAQIALQTMSVRFQAQSQPLLRDVATFLTSALLHAHHHIIRYAADRGMLDTPRTTLVTAVIERNQLYVIHCGDSRLYAVRNGEVLMRTRDHSVAERQKPAEGAATANRNLLLSCLGSNTVPMFDVGGPLDLCRGDRIFLCSDGLWGTLKDEEICEQLMRGPLDAAVDNLVAEALRRAGSRSDNVSALAVEWEASDDFHSTYICTDEIEQGVFTSTLDAYASDAAIESGWEMDEETIERAIAEINEVIRTTSGRKP